MTDKWVQKLTKLAGEYQQESANGKVDKGKFLQNAIQIANDATEDCVSDEQTKQKQKEMIAIAESVAGKIFGFDPKDNSAEEEVLKPSKPLKKKPGKGKPSYLIPKKKPTDDNSDDKEDNTNFEQKAAHESTQSKNKPKKRPPKGKPSYLLPKTETEDESLTKNNDKGTNQQTLAQKKAELQATIDREEAEIIRLEKLAKERSKARAELESKIQMNNETTKATEITTSAVKNNPNGDNFVSGKTPNLSQELASLPPSHFPSPSAPPTSEDFENVSSPSAPPASEDTDFYSVVVPQGVTPGAAFKIEIAGEYFEVTCPQNVIAGQNMRVELPKQVQSERMNTMHTEISEANQPDQVHSQLNVKWKEQSNSNLNLNSNSKLLHYVIVPQGVSAGMPFRVAVDGVQFTVTCPASATAGQKVAVEVPANARGRSKSPKPQLSSRSTPSKQEHFVYIPPNIHPGMPFQAKVSGKQFQVICPPNTKPGMRIRVAPPLGRQHSRSLTPPRSSPQCIASKELYDAIVPNGVTPGQQFRIRVRGQDYYITCPPNARAGQRIRVPIMVQSQNNTSTTRRKSSLSPMRLSNNLQPYV